MEFLRRCMIGTRGCYQWKLSLELGRIQRARFQRHSPTLTGLASHKSAPRSHVKYWPTCRLSCMYRKKSTPHRPEQFDATLLISHDHFPKYTFCARVTLPVSILPVCATAVQSPPLVAPARSRRSRQAKLQREVRARQGPA